MGLPETFKSIRPSVVAFIDRIFKTKQGEKPV
jgi:hypothetical protein